MSGTKPTRSARPKGPQHKPEGKVLLVNELQLSFRLRFRLVFCTGAYAKFSTGGGSLIGAAVAC